MVNNDKLCDVLWGMFIPPVRVYKFKGRFTLEVFIAILLWLFGWIGGIWYTFTITGIDCGVSLCCILFPPLGYYVGKKKCDKDFCITLLLTFLLWIPGMIAAFYFNTTLLTSAAGYINF